MSGGASPGRLVLTMVLTIFVSTTWQVEFPRRDDGAVMMVAGDGADTASADFCPSPPGPASTTRVGESLAHRDRIITSTQLPACLNGALLTPGVHMPERTCWRPVATPKVHR